MFIKNVIDDGFEESDFHKHMILNRKACEDLSLVSDKTTAIIATYQSQIDCLMWAVFSLLLRSSGNLEHLIVCINGPDSRTGDTSVQDTKQEFLEDLRSLKWNDRDMPITIARVWSRIGHGEAIEMAIPWVHTKAYTLLHDDMIVTNPAWAEESMQLLENEEVAAVYNPPILGSIVSTYNFQGAKKLNLPHINTPMVTCKKALIKERWTGYHVNKEFNIKKDLSEKEFRRFYKGLLAKYPEKFDANFEYDCLSQDFGSWVFYQLKSERYKLIPKRMAEHLLSMSWHPQDAKLKAARPHIASLEMELINYPEYWELYKKYKTYDLFTNSRKINYEGTIA